VWLAPLTCTDACSCRHEYPQWRAQDLSRVFPSLEESGLELLRAMLQYDPARRISVSMVCLFTCIPQGPGVAARHAAVRPSAWHLGEFGMPIHM
jgi:hypothetical protein